MDEQITVNDHGGCDHEGHPAAKWSSLDDHRRIRARTLAALFAAGGSLSAVVVVLPGWSSMQQLPIFALAALALICGAVLWRWGHALSGSAVSGFLAFGTIIIGAAQSLAGGGTASAYYAMLYVWVALHSAMYFPRRIVAVHLAGTVVVHASALVYLDELNSVAPRIALTLGTQIAASMVVGGMAGHLRALADTDHLTGLANRRNASQMLSRTLTSARRGGGRFSVAMLDLNEFKALNDQLGHAAGDAVLVTAAEAWSSAIDPAWTLARTGGDEFLLIIPDSDCRVAEAAVERLHEATPQVQFSAGLAYWDGRETVTALLERADRALYEAKAMRAPGSGTGVETAGRRSD